MPSSEPFDPSDLPADILPDILHQLTDRKDWHACALVSRTFNRVAIPLLYTTLDSRLLSKTRMCHPSSTLLLRPDLAKYVRAITETGAVHRALIPKYKTVTEDTLAALKLCTNITSITWVDDTVVSLTQHAHTILLSILEIVRKCPLRELTIRTHSDLGEAVWSQIITIKGLRKISIWCMEGPPRVLQGWPVGATLTHLELGRCAGVPPTILITVLSQLPRLQYLRLKGAPSASIPTIITYLPNLKVLDTEYLGSGNYRKPPHDVALPRLKKLTVRTSSMDTLTVGHIRLWDWIRELVPYTSLESFTLNSFTRMGQTLIPRTFMRDLARLHGPTLTEFIVGDAELTLLDIELLCSNFPNLEILVCSVISPDSSSISQAISKGSNLRILKLHVQWIPREADYDDNQSEWQSALQTPPQTPSPPLTPSNPRYGNVFDQSQMMFTVQDAKALMLRNEESRLRIIEITPVVYTGRWVLSHDLDDRHDAPSEEERLEFLVTADVAADKWHT